MHLHGSFHAPQVFHRVEGCGKHCGQISQLPPLKSKVVVRRVFCLEVSGTQFTSQLRTPHRSGSTNYASCLDSASTDCAMLLSTLSNHHCPCRHPLQLRAACPTIHAAFAQANVAAPICPSAPLAQHCLQFSAIAALCANSSPDSPRSKAGHQNGRGCKAVQEYVAVMLDGCQRLHPAQTRLSTNNAQLARRSRAGN